MRSDKIAQIDQDMAEIDETLAEAIKLVHTSLDRGLDVTRIAVAMKQTAYMTMDLDELASVLAVAVIRLAQAQRK